MVSAAAVACGDGGRPGHGRRRWRMAAASPAAMARRGPDQRGLPGRPRRDGARRLRPVRRDGRSAARRTMWAPASRRWRLAGFDWVGTAQFCGLRVPDQRPADRRRRPVRPDAAGVTRTGATGPPTAAARGTYQQPERRLVDPPPGSVEGWSFGAGDPPGTAPPAPPRQPAASAATATDDRRRRRSRPTPSRGQRRRRPSHVRAGVDRRRAPTTSRRPPRPRASRRPPSSTAESDELVDHGSSSGRGGAATGRRRIAAWAR